MNTEDLLKQIALLTAYINNKVVEEQTWGLCNNVLLDNFPSPRVFASWELFSGDYAFPVGNGHSDYSSTVNMHDRRTKYGKLRLSLAKHCLAWCEKELKDTV